MYGLLRFPQSSAYWMLLADFALRVYLSCDSSYNTCIMVDDIQERIACG